MKRLAFVFLTLFFMGTGLCIADIIDNPATPINSKSSQFHGGTVELKVVLRITDENKDFLLQSPGSIVIADDGTIYVRDQVHILKFNQDGSFNKKMLKKGEGPGEVKFFVGYHLQKKEITIGDIFPTKIIRLTPDGKLINEFRVQEKGTSILIFVARWGDKYFFRKRGLPVFKGDNSQIGISNTPVFYSNSKGELTQTTVNIPMKTVLYIDKEKSQRKEFPLTYFKSAVAGEKYLYITGEERYHIYQMDMETGKLVREFRRQYSPVAYVEKATPGKRDKEIAEVLKREFFTDVYRLMADGENIWVITSTIDETRGALVDVFDSSGKYVDNFYLKHPNLKRPDDNVLRRITHHKGFIYCIELDDEESPNIVKYQMIKNQRDGN